jgi:hypothetical protein
MSKQKEEEGGGGGGEEDERKNCSRAFRILGRAKRSLKKHRYRGGRDKRLGRVLETWGLMEVEAEVPRAHSLADGLSFHRVTRPPDPRA